MNKQHIKTIPATIKSQIHKFTNSQIHMPKSSVSPAPRRLYHFFKVFLPNLSSTHLRIPPAFQHYVDRQAPARFHLKGPSDFVWGVDLVKKSDGLFFADGWKAFAFDHSLASGDFLLFKYNGSSTFSVMIFDSTACEKAAAFFARPTCDGEVKFSVERVKEEEDERALIGINQSVKRRKTLVDSANDCSAVVMATMWSMQGQAAQALISERLDGSLKKRNRGFVSQRRPVTQKEKNDALAKAKSFKSDKPFFTMVMKASYVYQGFYLTLPGAFPHHHLPDYTGELFLHDPNKKQWTVRYIFSRRPALSGGWGKFAVGNNLETDDICIFELIAKKHMKVHIFRVLEDVKPLLRIGQVRNLGLNEVNENLIALIDH